MDLTMVGEFLRYVNAGLAMFCAMVLLASTVLRWSSYPRRLRRILPWVVALLLTNAYGSGEALYQETPVGVRVALAAVSLTGLTVSLVVGFRHGLDDPRP